MRCEHLVMLCADRRGFASSMPPMRAPMPALNMVGHPHVARTAATEEAARHERPRRSRGRGAETSSCFLWLCFREPFEAFVAFLSGFGFRAFRCRDVQVSSRLLSLSSLCYSSLERGMCLQTTPVLAMLEPRTVGIHIYATSIF